MFARVLCFKGGLAVLFKELFSVLFLRRFARVLQENPNERTAVKQQDGPFKIFWYFVPFGLDYNFGAAASGRPL